MASSAAWYRLADTFGIDLTETPTGVMGRVVKGVPLGDVIFPFHLQVESTFLGGCSGVALLGPGDFRAVASVNDKSGAMSLIFLDWSKAPTNASLSDIRKGMSIRDVVDFVRPAVVASYYRGRTEQQWSSIKLPD